MSVELYLVLLMCSTVATIVLTEALKRLLNASGTLYRANIVTLDASMFCGTLTGLLFKSVLGLGLSFSFVQVVRLAVVILSTWIASMVVYDKMQQTIRQYREYKERKWLDGKKKEKA